MSNISVMPSGVSVAGLGRRILATILDAVPTVLVAGGAALYLTYGKPSSTLVLVVGIVAAVLVLAWALYLWWAYATRGAGPGARLAGIQVLGLKDGRPIGWGRYFLRELVWTASAAFVIPWLVLVVMMITHQRRQGWHDLAAACVVVKRSRALESGGSVARSSVQSATTVGLPPHLTGSSFAGSGGSADELPSSIGYTPTALGVSAPAGPITSVPGSFGASEPPRDGAVPSYQPASQPGPQPYRSPTPTPAPPARLPGPPAVPWEQWGTQGPGTPPPAGQQPVSFAGPSPQQPPAVAQPYGQSPPPVQGAPQEYPPKPPPGVPPQRGGQDGDDYGGTHLASAVEMTRTTPGAAAGWQVRLDDGRVIDIDGVVLIGRNPAARPDETVSQLVSAGADGRMVSKTHLAVGVDQRGLYVTDRGSTNGTAIASPGGRLVPCVPGEQVRVREGQTVSFGDRSFEILRTQ